MYVATHLENNKTKEDKAYLSLAWYQTNNNNQGQI